jgi:hypothetical protein
MTAPTLSHFSDTESLLRDFFRALPLQSSRTENLGEKYVNRATDKLRDPILNLRASIRNEPEEDNACYLFSGLRGSGKTTELKRLIGALRDQDGIHAYYCDASEYLNITDPQFGPAEIVMMALAGLSDAIRREHGKDCLGSTSFWEKTQTRIEEFFGSKIEFKPKVLWGSEGAMFEVEATLTENPTFRKKLTEFGRQSSIFYDDAAKYAKELAEIIRKKDKERAHSKIVLVVDSMERFTAPGGEEAKLFDSLKETFFHEIDKLRFPSFSVVYAVPPYLRAVLPGERLAVSGYETLSSFKVVKNREDLSPNPEGIRQMVEIIDRRFPDWQKILKMPILKYLASASGGNVRFFFRILCEMARLASIDGKTLPITSTRDKVIDYALKNISSDWQWLNAPDRRWLKKFMNSSDPFSLIENEAADLPSIIRLFTHSLVFNYQNGESWYQVPPLLRDYLQRHDDTLGN